MGYASNAVLARASEPCLDEVQLVHRFSGHSDANVRRFERIADYQAGTRPNPRWVVVEVEVTPRASQRCYAATNFEGPAKQLCQSLFVQRGDVPERPIGESKNGLTADRLSWSGFCADALKTLVAAYAPVVPYR